MKDLDLSENLMKEYSKLNATKMKEEGDIEQHFYVLGQGTWPIST
jgi:hypothetical protein